VSAPDPAAPPSGSLARTPLLPAVGWLYVGLGAVLGGVWLVGGVDASLFPTGWLLPAVLVTSGLLMAMRRRFDIVGVLWAGLVLAVFQLDLAVYLDGAALGVDDPAAFDATLITAFLGLVPLVLRPHFRR
jgi:hypothetical protein